MELRADELCQLVGENGFKRLAAAFFRRAFSDPLIGPLYRTHKIRTIEERLHHYLVYQFGGPKEYRDRRGAPRLLLRHATVEIDQSTRDRWVSLMSDALTEAALPAGGDQMLREFFADAATFLMDHIPGRRED